MEHSKDVLNSLIAVRVRLNWHMAYAEQWPIKIGQTTDIEEISEMFVPWYRTQTHFGVDYNAERASPVTVANVWETLENWIEKKQCIYQYAYKFSQGEFGNLAIPVYMLPNGKMLILDGNHRCVALALAQKPFQATLVKIQGPCSRDALPDLMHWEDQVTT